ncbi:MAG: hypothetical protein M3O67_00735 [Bacteroidota bacterium]|nr:hypothetical protein [Bacteroidota bacterium]
MPPYKCFSYLHNVFNPKAEASKLEKHSKYMYGKVTDILLAAMHNCRVQPLPAVYF